MKLELLLNNKEQELRNNNAALTITKLFMTNKNKQRMVKHLKEKGYIQYEIIRVVQKSI